jgi:hypothetical protein
MPSPLSLRLDEDDQLTLESAAQQRGIGLSTYLRQLAADEAKRLRRERIRQQSLAVGQFVAGSPEAEAFYADWGSSAPKIGE